MDSKEESHIEKNEDRTEGTPSDTPPSKLAEENGNEKPKKTSSFRLSFLFSMLVLSITVTSMAIFVPQNGTYYVEKEKIKSDVLSLINNGATLDDIKHHYSGDVWTEWTMLESLRNDQSEYYTNDVLLISVIKDIKNDLRLKGSPSEDEIKRLTDMVKEYQQRNPFDGLEVSQRDHFENIRMKLGDDYEKVKIEVNKLSKELQQKNRLVNQYLSDSETSLYVSIASFAFALIISVAGPFFRRRSTTTFVRKLDSSV